MPFTDFDWFTGMYVTEDLMNKELDNQRYNRSLASIKAWINELDTYQSAPLPSAPAGVVQYDSTVVSQVLGAGTHYLSNIDITSLAAGVHQLVVGSLRDGVYDLRSAAIFVTDENARYLSVIATITHQTTGEGIITSVSRLFAMTHRDPVSW